MTPLLRLLRHPRTSRFAALGLLGYFVGEWIVSASWRGAFTYRWARSGELGIPYCGRGDIPCSAIWPVMDAGMIITGVAIIVIAASWRALNWAPNAATAALIIGGIGLIGAAVITERVDYQWHVIALDVFFVFTTAGCLLVGVSNTTWLPGSGRTVLTVAGTLATVGYFALTGGLTGWLGPGGTERVVIYSLLAGLLIAGLRGAKRIDARPAGQGVADDAPTETFEPIAAGDPARPALVEETVH